jgi:hypothetical protein
MPEPLRLTRAQLAAFLPDFESIKAFEDLFYTATEENPAVSTDLEAILYSMARHNSVPTQISNRITDQELQQPRKPDLTDIYRQLAEIKSFLGMQ